MGAVELEFDKAVYSLDALNAAAYRLIGVASCQIESAGSKYLCRLTPAAVGTDSETVRLRFTDCVTDERLRERLSAQTEPVRNLILSLAFGAFATEPSKQA